MYEIELLDGQKMWMNERIIKKVHTNVDGTFTLYHFDNAAMPIKSFKKL